MTGLNRRLVVAAAATALVVAGCGRGDDGGTASGSDGAATGPGVTAEPCPDGGAPDRGCIFLGNLNDLTGPFSPLAVPLNEATIAFWDTVNAEGGIGGYDIDVETYLRDTQYNPQVHSQAYQEIKDSVLALSVSLGSPTTQAILQDMKSSNIYASGVGWSSFDLFEPVVLESGSSYCVDGMNGVDYAVDQLGAQTIMAVHYPGDYGGDVAAGARIASEARGVAFTDVETRNGQDNQGGAVDAIVSGNPAVVVLGTTPTDAAVLIGQSVARGYAGMFIGAAPTWNRALLQSPAAPAFISSYLQMSPWGSFNTEGPGYDAMRAALPDVEPNDAYTFGWVWQYPIRSVLEQAAEEGKLTREGIAEVVGSLVSVDYEGMLPEGAGNYSADPNEGAVRASIVNRIDPSSPTGVTPVQELTAGPTASAYEFTAPCYQTS